jgi:hypothetical protein
MFFSARKVGKPSDFGVHLRSCLSVPDFISSCPHFLARHYEQTQTVKRRTRSSIIYGAGVSNGEYEPEKDQYSSAVSLRYRLHDYRG